jgi:hypothetical protein
VLKEDSPAMWEDICNSSEIIYKKRCTKCKKYYLVGKKYRSAGSYYCLDCATKSLEEKNEWKTEKNSKTESQGWVEFY